MLLEFKSVCRERQGRRFVPQRLHRKGTGLLSHLRGGGGQGKGEEWRPFF